MINAVISSAACIPPAYFKRSFRLYPDLKKGTSYYLYHFLDHFRPLDIQLKQDSLIRIEIQVTAGHIGSDNVAVCNGQKET